MSHDKIPEHPGPVLDRRAALKAAGVGMFALAGGLVVTSRAVATPEAAAEALAALTGGGAMQDGRVTVELPDLAENGRTVPLTVTVDSPMTAADHVTAIHVVNDGNPRPDVVTFHLGAHNGKAEVATRVRMSQSQTITVAAVMSGGAVHKASRFVKVTVGGC